MDRRELKERTKSYAVRIVKMVSALPHGREMDVLGKQLLRSGTSVGANYRAACRAKSNADFINKLKIVEEECDESLFWMEVITEAGLVSANRMSEIMTESEELLAITVASIKTARANEAARKS